MKQPTFDDVAGEEKTWDSAFIVRMYNEGHKLQEIQDSLPAAAPSNTVRGIIMNYKRRLEEGKDVYNGKARPQRWNNTRSDRKPAK